MTADVVARARAAADAIADAHPHHAAAITAALDELERAQIVEVASVGAHALFEDAEQALELVRDLCEADEQVTGRGVVSVEELRAALPPYLTRPSWEHE